jgi:uncharacterized protein YjiS (DUF1127 family)
MRCITIDSGPHRETIAEAQDEGKASIVEKSLGAVFKLASACRNRIALAMMSERDLDDLGVLPWEVRSEITEEMTARLRSRRYRTPVGCDQA